MNIADYDAFVRRTVQYHAKSNNEGRKIALYGLVSEIGSLIAAVKKRLLAETGDQHWSTPNEEIIEELGDAFWYGFALAQNLNTGRPVNVLRNDIDLLLGEVGGNDARAETIRKAVGEENVAKFFERARSLPRGGRLGFTEYQECAFYTARSTGMELLSVCLAVLWQLGAELLRSTLPAIERNLNRQVADRPPEVIMGEIAWHLSAIASIYRVPLDRVVRANIEKVSFRANRTAPTPLHDGDMEPSQQLPRKFDVVFLSVGPGRARMYFEGQQLGDDLTDNAYREDGYRFHDVMHLANAACLGWSPVLRKMLGRKRKKDPRLDEVEDGARAQIVEELVIKAIHTEGSRAAPHRDSRGARSAQRLFGSQSDLTFGFLKRLREYVRGLEVHKNRFWEWEEAILAGAHVFHLLVEEGQGTATVDLERRALTFSPEIDVDIQGNVCALGSSLFQWPSPKVQTGSSNSLESKGVTSDSVPRLVAAKHAVLDALGVQSPSADQLDLLTMTLLNSGRVSIKAHGAIREEMWRRHIVTFTVRVRRERDLVIGTALGIC